MSHHLYRIRRPPRARRAAAHCATARAHATSATSEKFAAAMTHHVIMCSKVALVPYPLSS